MLFAIHSLFFCRIFLNYIFSSSLSDDAAQIEVAIWVCRNRFFEKRFRQQEPLPVCHWHQTFPLCIEPFLFDFQTTKKRDLTITAHGTPPKSVAIIWRIADDHYSRFFNPIYDWICREGRACVKLM